MTAALSTLIRVGQLADRLADANTLVFDCRFDLNDPDNGRKDYDTGHIPGARYAHLNDNLAGPVGLGTGRHPLPDVDVFITWLREQGLCNRHQVVIYDDSAGAMAARLWWMLRHWLGHTATAVLDGGWNAWAEAGLPVESARPETVPGDFAARPDTSRVVDSDTVAQRLNQGSACLIDARMPRRFRGEMEPLDPAAGHIPGARNVPFTANLAASGRFAEPGTLRSQYQQVLEHHAPADTICSCGSGVTACHNLLAMDLAGLSGAQLYVGSWSAWCSDPARPIVTS